MMDATIWDGILSLGVAVLSVSVGIFLMRWLCSNKYVENMNQYYVEGQYLHSFAGTVIFSGAILTLTALAFTGVCALLFGLMTVFGSI